MRRLLAIVFCIYSLGLDAQGPFAPPAGQAGSTAIAADDNRFVGWTTSAVLERGFMDISNPSMGLASVGNEGSAIGKPFENGVVSLGDGGVITLNFLSPIQNVPGPDFAVFENGFDDYFLELAFVEVSSDGVNFFRFPSVSLTDTTFQVAYDTIHASNLYNLAGKYRAGFGTPFDLEELNGKIGLNINSITHVRLVDVVGSVNPKYASRDSSGRPINDPWPTSFPSSGFDLDAVGVIGAFTGIDEEKVKGRLVSAFPNPAQSTINVTSKYSAIQKIELYDQTGRICQTKVLTAAAKSDHLELMVSSGVYFIKTYTSTSVETIKLLVR